MIMIPCIATDCVPSVFSLLTVTNILGSDILLARDARGTPLVVALATSGHSLIVEHLAFAPTYKCI